MSRGLLKVLLVEDSSDDVDLLRTAVSRSKLPIEFEVVWDGQEALDYLHRSGTDPAQKIPDLILLDLNLPRKNGREVLGEIKKHSRLQVIPVVVFTTSSADVDRVTCYRLGAAAYLVKPSDFTELTSLAKRIYDFWERVEFAENPHGPHRPQ